MQLGKELDKPGKVGNAPISGWTRSKITLPIHGSRKVQGSIGGNTETYQIFDLPYNEWFNLTPEDKKDYLKE